MEVLRFDPAEGVYGFYIDEIQTKLHRHPAMEVIISKTVPFSLSYNGNEYTELMGCIFPANTDHAVHCLDGGCMIYLLENGKTPSDLEVLPFENRYEPEEGLVLTKVAPFVDPKLGIVAKKKDERVRRCQEKIIELLPHQSVSIRDLADLIHLSESRLSHLFKQEVGVSIKKYKVWIRLRYVIEEVLNKETNLMDAALSCDFHDLSHFSRSFEQMFGINPSTSYNSRTVQI